MGQQWSNPFNRKTVDEATSNSSLWKIRFVTIEKPRWKFFSKKEVRQVSVCNTSKGCWCGNEHPCKKKVTPKGVHIHYPDKKKDDKKRRF